MSRGVAFMSCSCSFYRQTELGIEALINLSGFSKLADLQKLVFTNFMALRQKFCPKL